MTEQLQQPEGERAARFEVLQRRAMIAIVIAIVVYAGFALFADVRQLTDHLGSYAWWTFAAALALSLANYGIRAVRWEYYLRLLDIRVPMGPSQAIFMSGFAFSVTPGKVGELLKSFFLKRDFDVPVSRSAPVVVGERLTDFLALCLLLLVGIFSYNFHTTALLAAVGVVIAGTVVLATPQLSRPLLRAMSRLPVVGGVALKLESMTESMAALLRPVPLLGALLLSVISWGAECVGLWLILIGLDIDVSLQLATFIYAATTLLGAITMIPGGLGVTEASMVSAVIVLGGAERSAAVAGTLLCRIATLWFAVGIGFIALWLYRRARRGSDVDALASPPETS